MKKTTYSGLTVKNAYLSSKNFTDIKRKKAEKSLLYQGIQDKKFIRLPITELTERQRQIYLAPNKFEIKLKQAGFNTFKFGVGESKRSVNVRVADLTQRQIEKYLRSNQLFIRDTVSNKYSALELKTHVDSQNLDNDNQFTAGRLSRGWFV